jgi:Restriction endonuclease NaeI
MALARLLEAFTDNIATPALVLTHDLPALSTRTVATKCSLKEQRLFCDTRAKTIVYGRFPLLAPLCGDADFKRNGKPAWTRQGQKGVVSERFSTDTEMAAVALELRKLDSKGSRMAHVLRDTFDQVYDGQRTGRYRWDQLFGTEVTGCGPLVEINLQREFEFLDGVTLNYLIAGVEVDCKYSQTIGAWVIPPEAQGRVCLLLSGADTAIPTWSMGLVRAITDHLDQGTDRASNGTLNDSGRKSITWLFKNAPLPANVLLQLDAQSVQKIFAKKSGQKRINDLFRLALGRPVGQAAIATVAQQNDHMKRVRAIKDARRTLQPEGIIILGQFGSHARVARELRVPVPGSGESVAVQISPTKKRGPGVAEIAGKLWRIARAGDTVVDAPDLPSV